MVLWLAGPEGKRRRLIDRSFAPCFYVHGPESRLAPLAQVLAGHAAVKCVLTEKTDIWDGGGLRVLEVTVRHPTQFATLVRFVHQYDSRLRLYNSDLMLAPMYCWEKGVFPLAKVEVEVGEGSALPPSSTVADRREPKGLPYQSRAGTRPAPTVRALKSCDDEWATDYELPPLRIMRVRLEGLSNVDPQHGRRGALEVEIDGEWRVLDDSEEPVAVGFERLLRAHDPDMILSEWGDSTLFPALLRQARKLDLTLSLNRDAQPVEHRRARSYMSYGRILFKGSTTTLFGRLHVDTQNSFIAEQCDLEGLWELARVTKLPVQYCARTTTGTGISYMQMELAYGDGVLIPEQKAEPESPKHPDELLRADRGGLVFLPRLGFFTNVGELDFISEFPSIMARFNISPETVNCGCCPEAPRIPELGYRICQRRRGINSRVVERLIQKRQEYKRQMADDRKGGVLTPPQSGSQPFVRLAPRASSFQGATTAGSNVVTGVTNIGSLRPGQFVAGAGIAPLTIIAAINSAQDTITLGLPATAASNGPAALTATNGGQATGGGWAYGISKITDAFTYIPGYTYQEGLTYVQEIATITANWYQAAGILLGGTVPGTNASLQGMNYFAIDKFGIDGGYPTGLTAPGYKAPQGEWINGMLFKKPAPFFYNGDEWNSYLTFGAAIHNVLSATGTTYNWMMWQIPEGHINTSLSINPMTGTQFPALTNNTVLDPAKNLYPTTEDSAVDYFFGDTFTGITEGADNQERVEFFGPSEGNFAGDSGITFNTSTNSISWGSHMSAAANAGVFAILFGAGLPQATNGGGYSNVPVVDDHFFAVKAQHYLAAASSANPAWR
ncbi:MAG: DNA polymerase domain-containing protein [Terriglobia bacterium]